MNTRKHMYFTYRSFWPEPQAHRRFDALGVDTVCFFASNTTNSLLKRPGGDGGPGGLQGG